MSQANIEPTRRSTRYGNPHLAGAIFGAVLGREPTVKRPVFLISSEGKPPDELKEAARTALARFSQAVAEADATEARRDRNRRGRRDFLDQEPGVGSEHE